MSSPTEEMAKKVEAKLDAAWTWPRFAAVATLLAGLVCLGIFGRGEYRDLVSGTVGAVAYAVAGAVAQRRQLPPG